MKKYLFSLLIALTLLGIVPAFAQDEIPVPTAEPTLAATVPAPEPTAIVTPAPTPAPTPEPTNVNTLFWIFSAVIFGLLAAIVLVLRPLIIQLGASAPSWAVEASYSAVRTLLDKGAQFADSTPEPVDNDLVAQLRKEIEGMKAEMDKLRQTTGLPGQLG